MLMQLMKGIVMSVWSIINVVAWVLCGLFLFLILGDMIKTEFGDRKKKQAEMEELKKKDVAAGVAVGANARVATDNLDAKLDAANADSQNAVNSQGM